MARLGGRFPFPVTGAQTADVPISLPSGGTFTIPQGNWLLALGANTRLQWMDPVNLQWRSMTGQYGGGFISSDGTNYRLLNFTGTILSVNITAAGTGGTNGIGATQTGVAVAVAAAPGGGPYNATAYAVVGGSVAAPTVTRGGSGFVAPPLIICDAPPPGGVQATAYATLSSAGVITAITIDNPGAGYPVTPNWYIFPEPAVYYGSPIAGIGPDTWPAPGLIDPSMQPPGSVFQPNFNSVTGALLTPVALTGSGTVTALQVLDPGGGYSGTVTATVTGAGAATASTTVGAAAAVDRSFLQSRVS